MTRDYLSVADWIYDHPIPDENARPQYAPEEGSNAGRTAWLRAYLAAFMVQEIYYDWNIQKQAVRNAFEEIFAFAARYEHLPTEERCDLINREFYTRFDPVSLGAAKQFLEEVTKPND